MWKEGREMRVIHQPTIIKPYSVQCLSPSSPQAQILPWVTCLFSYLTSIVIQIYFFRFNFSFNLSKFRIIPPFWVFPGQLGANILSSLSMPIYLCGSRECFVEGRKCILLELTVEPTAQLILYEEMSQVPRMRISFCLITKIQIWHRKLHHFYFLFVLFSSFPALFTIKIWFGA